MPPIVTETASAAYMLKTFRRISGFIKGAKFLFNGGGVACIAVGQTLPSINDGCFSDFALLIFWFGVVLIVVFAVVVMLFDRDEVSLLVAVVDKDKENADLLEYN